MSASFTIPEDYHAAFRRLLPYMAPALRNDEHVLQALLLYLRLGNEKLARIAIDAYNETYRLKELEIQKQLREQALLGEILEQEESEASDDESEGGDEKDESSDY